MDIRIGLAESPRELAIEMADDTDADKMAKEIAKAIENGTVMWLTDAKGRRIAVRGDRINYVDIGTESGPKMGFGA